MNTPTELTDWAAGVEHEFGETSDDERLRALLCALLSIAHSLDTIAARARRDT